MTDLIERLRLKMIKDHWSGHGEGGNLAKVVLANPPSFGNPYNSKPEDYEAAEEYVTETNAALEAKDLRIAELEAALEWVGANTDSPSTALYCHRALEDSNLEGVVEAMTAIARSGLELTGHTDRGLALDRIIRVAESGIPSGNKP